MRQFSNNLTARLRTEAQLDPPLGVVVDAKGVVVVGEPLGGDQVVGTDGIVGTVSSPSPPHAATDEEEAHGEEATRTTPPVDRA